VTDHLSDIDDGSFARIVDEDVRGKASAEDHAGLRVPAVVPRWLRQLRKMELSVSGTLEARDADHEVARIEAILGGDERRALELRRDHLRWRAGAVRFRTGVRETLLEAEDLADRLPRH
jgi:hypothetical protein